MKCPIQRIKCQICSSKHWILIVSVKTILLLLFIKKESYKKFETIEVCDLLLLNTPILKLLISIIVIGLGILFLFIYFSIYLK